MTERFGMVKAPKWMQSKATNFQVEETTMNLGQGHYQVTKVEMNQWGTLDITLSCSTVQEIQLQLSPIEAQTLVDDIWNTVDSWRENERQKIRA